MESMWQILTPLVVDPQMFLTGCIGGVACEAMRFCRVKILIRREIGNKFGAVVLSIGFILLGGLYASRILQTHAHEGAFIAGFLFPITIAAFLGEPSEKDWDKAGVTMSTDDPLAPSTSQTELVAALIKGEEAAFERFYRKYVPGLTVLAGQWLAPEDAEEVADDVLFEAARDIRKYDAKRGSLWTWLVVRCRTRAIDRARQTQQRTRVIVASSPDLVDAMSSEPSQAIESPLDIQAFWGTLSRQEREVIVLHYIYGLHYKEVATRMGIKVSTVKEYSDRARAKLKVLLT